MTDIISTEPADATVVLDSLPEPDPTVTPAFSFADREPIRLPLWAASIGSVTVAGATSLLAGTPWRVALTAALGALGPLLFGTEIARQAAWSPPAVLQAAQQARDDGVKVGARAQRAAANAARVPPLGG